MRERKVERMRGIVRRFHPERGYGFIDAGEEHGSDFFLHVTNVIGTGYRPQTGDHVTFIPSVDRHGRGVAALRVQRIDGD